MRLKRSIPSPQFAYFLTPVLLLESLTIERLNRMRLQWLNPHSPRVKDADGMLATPVACLSLVYQTCKSTSGRTPLTNHTNVHNV
jgi:hypothetical protein